MRAIIEHCTTVMMASTIVNCLAALLLTYAFLQTLLRFTQNVQEPPPVDTSLPFVSPIIRMAMTGVKYWKINRLDICDQRFSSLKVANQLDASRLPIYTIRLPATRFYVVNSRSLISALDRSSRTVSFSPILSRVASNLIAASKSGVEILSQDEEDGFIAKFHDFNQAQLSPGPSLDVLKRKIWEVTTALCSQDNIGSKEIVHMYTWISDAMVIIVTEAMYGQENPFRAPAIQSSW